MIENITDLADRLKGIKVDGADLSPEKLKDLINDEKKFSLEVATPGKFYTDPEIETFRSNVNNGSMRDGVISGAEQTVKAFKKITGLDYEGKVVTTSDGKVDFDATVSNLHKNLSAKMEETLKLPVDKKVKELSESLENLQKTYQKDISEKENLINQERQKYGALEETTYIATHATKAKDHKPNHLVAAFKADGYGTDLVDGRRVPTLNGKVIKDKTENPEPFDKVFDDWLTKNNYLTGVNGRGGGNEGGSGGGTFKNESDVYKHMKDNGIDPTGPEGQKLLSDFNK